MSTIPSVWGKMVKEIKPPKSAHTWLNHDAVTHSVPETQLKETVLLIFSLPIA